MGRYFFRLFPIEGYKLFYYKKEDSTLEADFFIRSAASLIPVEVKAKSGRAKSMKTLITSEHYPSCKKRSSNTKVRCIFAIRWYAIFAA